MNSLYHQRDTSIVHALLYFTDCQIATLGYFACCKSASKNETQRHWYANDRIIEMTNLALQRSHNGSQDDANLEAILIIGGRK